MRMSELTLIAIGDLLQVDVRGAGFHKVNNWRARLMVTT